MKPLMWDIHHCQAFLYRPGTMRFRMVLLIFFDIIFDNMRFDSLFDPSWEICIPFVGINKIKFQ